MNIVTHLPSPTPRQEGGFSRGQWRLHVLAFAGVHEGREALQPVTREAQQVDDLQQVWRDHGDAQVEEAVAEADRALEPVQGLGRHAAFHRGVVVVGVVCLLLAGGPPLAGLPQLADVAVTLVVHLPGLAEDPATLDVSWERRR